MYEKDINHFIDLTFGEDPTEMDFAKTKISYICAES